jgi:hypothetical protein
MIGNVTEIIHHIQRRKLLKILNVLLKENMILVTNLTYHPKRWHKLKMCQKLKT